MNPPDLIKVAHTLAESAPSQHNEDAFLLIANVLESRVLMSLNLIRPSFPHIDACASHCVHRLMNQVRVHPVKISLLGTDLVYFISDA